MTNVNIRQQVRFNISGMNSQILAAAYFLQRLHGAGFAASFLEDYGVSREWALRLLADRPPERALPARATQLRAIPTQSGKF